MVKRVLPDVEPQNNWGACWTCLDSERFCDSALPHCNTCVSQHIKCGGYGVRIEWPQGVRMPNFSPSSPAKELAALKSSRVTSSSILPSLSPFSAEYQDNILIQHFIRHVSSISLAVDYTENGYRMLTPMAVQEPALFNTMLAIAAAHQSRWQKVEDKESRKYLRKALVALQELLKDPEAAVKESTLCTILCLVSYEVFNGTGRWRQHFQGVAGWIKHRGDCSNISPFVKTWICLIDTQAALNLGHNNIPELDDWLDDAASRQGNQAEIDPLFGCSTQLPKLMLEAARLFRSYHRQGSTPLEDQDSLRIRAEALKAKIKACAIEPQFPPGLAVSCGRAGLVATASKSQYQTDYLDHMCATAEIFRHALLVYLFRAVNGAEVPLDSETQYSIDKSFELLACVPDALGPGSNLGWALVIIGSEVDAPDLRQYLRCRWRGLTLLEMSNNKSGERLTEAVWHRRDAAGPRVLWQDVMQDIGGEQILV